MGSITTDLAAGTLAGAAQLLVGHPFDTTKGQASEPAEPAAGSCAAGMAAPLATVALLNAVATRGQMEHLFEHTDASELTVGDQFVAGVGAGVAVSLLACPMELVKCRLQAQTAAAGGAAAYQGPVDVAAAVHAWTLASMGSLVAAGGVAGACFWLPIYPADVVKSCMQVDSLTAPQYRSSADCFRQTLRSQGVAGLYRGFGRALARSVPANGTCFVVYELARMALGQAVGAAQVPARLPAYVLPSSGEL
ncbi:hypothetical protein WJX81_005698 [Elliptochloris bilobata]|uniref:Uncharacterized protein n=1 Tax=Elliptochloris bilobata TaxID=381761 RepID=A0AAW1QLA6_9CHLO